LHQGILSASTSILNHFSSALSQYAAHGHSMRDQLKAIRTKEESLDDLERRRRVILRKAEDVEKKLKKISPDNKYFTMQTDILNRLRDDIQTLNSDFMSEEAALNKFKRSATKVWMGLKFGGLVECCQKGTVRNLFHLSSNPFLLSHLHLDCG
jgi:chromosome segregation ATPase